MKGTKERERERRRKEQERKGVNLYEERKNEERNNVEKRKLAKRRKAEKNNVYKGKQQIREYRRGRKGREQKVEIEKKNKEYVHFRGK